MVITDKERLLDRVEHLTDAQCEKLNEIIGLMTRGYISKGDIMKLADIKQEGKIDTALPIDYVRKVQEVYPQFSTMFHVMDYREESYGSLTNIAEAFVLNLSKMFHE